MTAAAEPPPGAVPAADRASDLAGLRILELPAADAAAERALLEALAAFPTAADIAEMDRMLADCERWMLENIGPLIEPEPTR